MAQAWLRAVRQLSSTTIWSFIRWRSSKCSSVSCIYLRGPSLHGYARNPPDAWCSSVIGILNTSLLLLRQLMKRRACIHRFIGASQLSCSGSNARRHPGDSSDDDATHEESQPSTPHSPAHGEEEDDDEVRERWNQAELYAADLRRASTPSPPKMRASYSTRYFKILVVRPREAPVMLAPKPVAQCALQLSPVSTRASSHCYTSCIGHCCRLAPQQAARPPSSRTWPPLTGTRTPQRQHPRPFGSPSCCTPPAPASSWRASPRSPPRWRTSMTPQTASARACCSPTRPPRQTTACSSRQGPSACTVCC